MKILLPVDGSSHSLRAARYLVRHWPADAAVTLLNVDPPLREWVAEQLDTDSVARFHLDNGALALKSAKRILAKAGHLFDERLLVGDPGTEIVQLARRGRYDLVMMGSHGRSALMNLLLGSVVTKVLSASSVPVLIVR